MISAFGTHTAHNPPQRRNEEEMDKISQEIDVIIRNRVADIRKQNALEVE